MSDDDIREGSETMHIVLSTNDSRVETDEALIIINDPEDGEREREREREREEMRR